MRNLLILPLLLALVGVTAFALSPEALGDGK
jgi:hypothetical protein